LSSHPRRDGKASGAAKHRGVAARSNAESCQTLMGGLIVGLECRDAYECCSHVSCAQRKGMAPRGAPRARGWRVATSRQRFVRRTARRPFYRTKACHIQSANHSSQQTKVKPLFDRARFYMILGQRITQFGVKMRKLCMFEN